MTATSMLNPTFGSSAVRFLKEISARYRFDVIDTIANIISSDYEYIPRITYKRVILKLATWLLSRDALGINDDKEDNFIQGLRDFRKKWNVPRYVHLAELDNRLLFDLDNPLHIHEIYHFVKKQNSRPLQLMEEVCNFDEYAAKDQAGRHYATAVIVSFCLSDDSLEHGSEADAPSLFSITSDIRLNVVAIAPREQLLLPGSENWLYFKMEMTARFLSVSNDQKSYRKKFQKDRKMHVRAANNLNYWAEIQQIIDYPDSYDDLIALSVRTREYAEAVFQADRDGVLTNSVESIARSIIHMFCNQLMGNNAWEQKTYALARHGSHDLCAHLKHRV